MSGDPIKPKQVPLPVPEIMPEILRRMNHGEWLEQFSKSLQYSREGRGKMVTPFLLGAITRLRYASQYVALLKNDLHWLARDNALLRKHIEFLGGVAAPPFRPIAESEAAHVNYPPAGESAGFDPATGETHKSQRESDEAIYRRGALKTMLIGPITVNTPLPGGEGWEPYDEKKEAAARAMGLEVHVNTRMPMPRPEGENDER